MAQLGSASTLGLSLEIDQKMVKVSDKMMTKLIFLALKKNFIKYLPICSFIDDCYELRSYERGVAQLGSAGALGALGRRFESCRPDS